MASSSSSSSSDSEQNQQPNPMGQDLNSKMITTHVMNTLPLGSSNNIETGSRAQWPNLALPGSSQNKQLANNSLALVPASANNSLALQAQSHAGNEDLFTVYMQGITKSRDQRLLQKNDQVPKSNNALIPVYGYTQNANEMMMNNPNLYYPNFPTGFSFPSSMPMFQPRLVGYSSQASVPFIAEDSRNNVNTLSNPSWAPQGHYSNAPMTMDGSSFPLRAFGVNQGIPNIANNAPTAFNEENGSSNQVQAPASSSQKRKTTWQEKDVPVRKRWQRFGTGELGQNSRASDDERYTLYDKRYEEIGLPVDPHLRLFNAYASKGKDAGRSP